MLHIVRGPVLRRRLHKLPDVRAFLLSSSEFSSDSSSPPGDGDDKPQKSQAAARKKATTAEEESKKSSAALNRLNELLAMMNTESELKLVKKVDLPRPKGKKAKERKAAGEESDSDSDAEERPRVLAQATRNVANALGGDPKKTESELLSKLLGSSAAGESGDSLTNIITGMAVDRDAQGKARDPTRSTLVKKSIDSKRSKQQQRGADDAGVNQRSDFASRDRSDRKRATQRQQQQFPSSPGGPGSVKLFDGEPLGIFTDLASLKDVPDKLPTWQKLQERELKLSVTHPPANYFQKMALWTEQGKLWKFPIDNEQGRDEEQRVPFTEHVFLEEHLESWCPTRGPIRHFMELVCVGLSKNHYITAQEKRDHIAWYRDYFEQKKDLLKEVIVQESDKAKGIEK